MPGPTPITSTHRLTLTLTSLSFQHKMRFYCDAFAALLSPSGYELHAVVGADRDVADVAEQVFTDIAPLYAVGQATFDSWLLEEHASGAYIFTAGGSITTVPSGSGSNTPGMEAYYIFKTATNKYLKVLLPEAKFGLPQRITSLSGLGAFGTFATDMTVGGTGSLADVLKSRGDEAPNRFLSFVESTNRRFRRRRGIA